MVIDILQLANLYNAGDVSEDFIVLHYGQEVLERIIHILTDPFNDVLGG